MSCFFFEIGYKCDIIFSESQVCEVRFRNISQLLGFTYNNETANAPFETDL